MGNFIMNFTKSVLNDFQHIAMSLVTEVSKVNLVTLYRVYYTSIPAYRVPNIVKETTQSTGLHSCIERQTIV